jgi:WD40 repeat protein
VLSFSDPRAWEPVATGCWAGLSPDGSSLVYSPDGAEIDTLRLPDGRPTKVLDTSRLRGIFPPGFPTPTLVGPPAWSENGLAFTIRSGGEVAIVVRRPSGNFVPVFREPLISTSQLPRISWQPGGHLLAIADDMGPSGGVLRLWDPESDHLRAIGLDLLGFSEPQWSPDGSSLASLTSAKSLIVFDPGGAWRLRVETTWEDLLAWGG